MLSKVCTLFPHSHPRDGLFWWMIQRIRKTSVFLDPWISSRSNWLTTGWVLLCAADFLLCSIHHKNGMLQVPIFMDFSVFYFRAVTLIRVFWSCLDRRMWVWVYESSRDTRPLSFHKTPGYRAFSVCGCYCACVPWVSMDLQQWGILSAHSWGMVAPRVIEAVIVAPEWLRTILATMN